MPSVRGQSRLLANLSLFFRVFTLPMCNRRAIHAIVIAVSRRRRHAMRTLFALGLWLLGQILLRPSLPRQFAPHQSFRPFLLALLQLWPIIVGPSLFAHLGQQFLPKRLRAQTLPAPHRQPSSDTPASRCPRSGPDASPSVSRNRWRSASSWQMASRRSPRFRTWYKAPGY